jgi:hypothetical protein
VHTLTTAELLQLLKLLEWQQAVIEALGEEVTRWKPTAICQRCGLEPAARKWCKACAKVMHLEDVKARAARLSRATRLAHGLPAESPGRGRRPKLVPLKEAS